MAAWKQSSSIKSLQGHWQLFLPQCVYILHTGPRDEANLALTGTLCNVLKHHADLVDTMAAAVAKTSQNTTEK